MSKFAGTLGAEALQSSFAVTNAKIGDNITLNCSFPEDKIEKFFWYKQEFGQIPRAIGLVSEFRSLSPGTILFNEFNNARFRIIKTGHSLYLTIIQTILSDEATYFCGVARTHEIELRNGTFLKFQGIYFS